MKILRKIVQVWGAALACLPGPVCADLAKGELDSSFAVVTSNAVVTVAAQPDGRWLLGGYFTSVNGVPRQYLARLNPDGSLDASFPAYHGSTVYALAIDVKGRILVGGPGLVRLRPDGAPEEGFAPNLGNDVYAVAFQPDGKILVGGFFWNLPQGSFRGILRLHENGQLDTSFRANIVSGFGVYAIRVLEDGKILIGGDFQAAQGAASIAHLARLNPDGSLDPTFAPQPNGAVYALTRDAGGRILIGGHFSSVGGIQRRGLARLNADGTPDPTLDAQADGSVYAIAPQADGGLLIGGSFTELRGENSPRLALLSSEGIMDSAFRHPLDGTVYAIGLAPDDTVVVAGSFTLSGAGRSHIVRFGNAASSQEFSVTSPNRAEWRRGGSSAEADSVFFDLSLDGGTTWHPLGYGGRIAGGWEMSNLRLGGAGRIRGRALTAVGAYYGAGGMDERHADFDFGGPAHRVAFDLSPYGYRVGGGALTQLILPGGAADAPQIATERGWTFSGWDRAFDSIAGETLIRALYERRRFWHETSFNPRVDSLFPQQGVYAVVVQPDGKIVLGGNFTSVAGESRSGLVRLHPDGALDAAFNPSPNGDVRALALHPDGGLLVGGSFSWIGGAPSGGLALLREDGTPKPGFNPELQGSVTSIAVGDGGELFVAGSFRSAGDWSPKYLVRLRPDGKSDPLFNPAANQEVVALAIDPDGRLLAGGLFTQIGGQTRYRMARFNADGTLDAGFTPNVGGTVRRIAVQSDGAILIGGDFTQVGGLARNRLARLLPDGAVDLTYNPNADGAINALALQADGVHFVGGAFSTVGGVSQPRIARLLPNGAVEGEVVPGAAGAVCALALQEDGRLLAGFVREQSGAVVGDLLVRIVNEPAAEEAPVAHADRIEWDRGGSSPEAERVSFTVSVDQGATWHPLGSARRRAGGWSLSGLRLGGAGLVKARALLPNSAYYSSAGLIEKTVGFDFGGEIRRVSFDLRNRGARIGGGALTQLVAPGSAAEAPAIRAYAGWRFVGWDTPFSAVTEDVAVRAVYEVAAGFLDADFNPNVGPAGPPTSVQVLAMQPDDKILVGGKFAQIGGQSRSNLARLLPDGTPDPSFAPAVAGTVYTIAVQSDGKIVIGGAISAVNGQTRRGIARLLPDGALDASFNPDLVGTVRALLLTPEGEFWVGGSFSKTVERETRYDLIRLRSDGSPDPLFRPQPRGEVNSLVYQPDRQILVGGSFSSIFGQSRSRLARLRADGTLDPNFNPPVNNSVLAVAPQPDGRIVIGGDFSAVGSVTTGRLARLNPDGSPDPDFNASVTGRVGAIVLQCDGGILIGGSFSSVNGSSRNWIARISPSGALDAAFLPSANSAVHAIALQRDGAVLLGGEFSEINAVRRNYLARVGNDSALSELMWAPEGPIRWRRGGAGPEAEGVSFELSEDDGATWLPLGDGERASDGWELTGVRLGRAGRLRARAYIADGSYGGGRGILGSDAAFAYPGDFYRVRFDLAGKGARAGGGALVQFVPPGEPAAPPAVTAFRGWRFAGWSSEFSSVTSDIVVTALYEPGPGYLDNSFSASSDGAVYAIAVLPDDRVLVGGSFQTINGQPCLRLARLRADGAPETHFNPSPNGIVFSLAVQPDGKILVGGEFTAIAGQPGPSLARLNSDGTLDSGFNAGVTDRVYAIVLRPDGRIVVIGRTRDAEGVYRLVQLNSDGSRDTRFDPPLRGVLRAVGLHPDGGTLVSGYSSENGVSRPYLVKVRPDAGLDGSFDPTLNGTVESIAVQPDGKIVIGGSFTAVNGQTRSGLARLHANGELDVGFQAPANVSMVNGVALQTDGAMLVTHRYGFDLFGLRRFLADGTSDASFDVQTNEWIAAFALQDDGKVLVGGGFTTLQREPVARLARLGNDPATGAFSLDTERAEWRRGGAAPEAKRVTFELSLDGGLAWLPLGYGERIAGGWQATGLRLRGRGLVRARALVGADGIYSGMGLLESGISFDRGGVYHLVRFDLGGKSERSGGGALTQMVEPGAAAESPTIRDSLEWEFDGWDADFSAVTSDMIVRARYKPARGTFARWLSDRKIAGDPAALFDAICPKCKKPYGWLYTFGANYRPKTPILDIRQVGDRTVLETPEQDPATRYFVRVLLRGTTDLVAPVWNLPIVYSTDTQGKPAGRVWYEPAPPAPRQAFFQLDVELK